MELLLVTGDLNPTVEPWEAKNYGVFAQEVLMVVSHHRHRRFRNDPNQNLNPAQVV